MKAMLILLAAALLGHGCRSVPEKPAPRPVERPAVEKPKRIVRLGTPRSLDEEVRRAYEHFKACSKHRAVIRKELCGWDPAPLGRSLEAHGGPARKDDRVQAVAVWTMYLASRYLGRTDEALDYSKQLAEVFEGVLPDWPEHRALLPRLVAGTVTDSDEDMKALAFAMASFGSRSAFAAPFNREADEDAYSEANSTVGVFFAVKSLRKPSRLDRNMTLKAGKEEKEAALERAYDRSGEMISACGKARGAIKPRICGLIEQVLEDIVVLSEDLHGPASPWAVHSHYALYHFYLSRREPELVRYGRERLEMSLDRAFKALADKPKRQVHRIKPSEVGKVWNEVLAERGGEPVYDEEAFRTIEGRVLDLQYELDRTGTPREQLNKLEAHFKHVRKLFARLETKPGLPKERTSPE